MPVWVRSCAASLTSVSAAMIIHPKIIYCSTIMQRYVNSYGVTTDNTKQPSTFCDLNQRQHKIVCYMQTLTML